MLFSKMIFVDYSKAQITTRTPVGMAGSLSSIESRNKLFFDFSPE